MQHMGIGMEKDWNRPTIFLTFRWLFYDDLKTIEVIVGVNIFRVRRRQGNKKGKN